MYGNVQTKWIHFFLTEQQRENRQEFPKSCFSFKIKMYNWCLFSLFFPFFSKKDKKIKFYLFLIIIWAHVIFVVYISNLAGIYKNAVAVSEQTIGYFPELSTHILRLFSMTYTVYLFVRVSRAITVFHSILSSCVMTRDLNVKKELNSSWNEFRTMRQKHV